MMRMAEIKRETAETKIEVSLEIEGEKTVEITTKCAFLDHMLLLFARHGEFGLTIKCDGDVDVDYHHTVEDVGIVLGRAFSKALGERKGIARYGSFVMPMDESLVLLAIDICGRATLAYKINIPSQNVGDFDTELVREFFLAFTRELGVALHIHQLAGENSHHLIEATFKGFGRALSMAVATDSSSIDKIPSTKGTIL